MRRVIDWFHFTPIRLRITKVIFAVVLAAGVLSVFLASAGLFDAEKTHFQPRDSAEIVVEAQVKNFEIAAPDGPVDPAEHDWEINVVDDAFRVTKVVHGTFDLDELRMLIHSPSQDGLTGPGQRFVLCLRRRLKPPRVVSPRDEPPGRPFFVLAKTLYEMVDDQRSTYPGWGR
jgi:hypothetical protein